MEMASIINQYYTLYLNKYGNKALPSHLKALNAIRHCQTANSGELFAKCPECDYSEWRPLSCGNRHCPKCQNHATSQWIDKQQMKLLPVPYFKEIFLPKFYNHENTYRSTIIADYHCCSGTTTNSNKKSSLF